MSNVPLGFALVCGGFFCLIISALGIFLVASSIRSRKKAESSQGWPSTTGQVTLAEVKTSANTDDDGNTTYQYYPGVQYDYQVGGQTYNGKRLSFGGIVASSSQAKVAEDLKKYPVGGEVAVYYNPESPSEAVLVREAGGFRWGMTVGIICLALGVCIACPLLIGVVRNFA